VQQGCAGVVKHSEDSIPVAHKTEMVSLILFLRESILSDCSCVKITVQKLYFLPYSRFSPVNSLLNREFYPRPRYSGSHWSGNWGSIPWSRRCGEELGFEPTRR